MQPELFQDYEPDPRLKKRFPPLFPHRFVRVRVAYEDIIFATLSLVLILLAGFCLGVERGKGLSDPSVDQAALMARTPEGNRLSRVARSVEMKRTLEKPRVMQKRVQKSLGGRYVIQLASYVNARPAQAEAERLRRAGFVPRVIRQGKYFELRVVGYESRSEALTPLATLRKTYHDGFIKRLSSG